MSGSDNTWTRRRQGMVWCGELKNLIQKKKVLREDSLTTSKEWRHTEW